MMYQESKIDETVQLIQAIMLNHLFGWIRLPMSNLLDRNDIIRYCCSRSWQTSHIIQLLFAINGRKYIDDYRDIIKEIDGLPRTPVNTVERLLMLACSGDFSEAIKAGIGLIEDLIYLADALYPQIRADAFFRVARNEEGLIISPEQKTSLAESIPEQYKTMQGVEAIILEGSLASGMQDDASDIDIIAYCNPIPDMDIRKQRLRMIDDRCLVLPQSDRFTIDGVYTHVDFELVKSIDDTLGIFPQSICQTFGLWEPIQIGKPVWDPKLKLREWKNIIANLAQEHKIQLIERLSLLLYEEKRQFDKAAQNNDLMYCSLVLGNILTIYFQILGVLNHRFIFFPKWANNLLLGMHYKPDKVYERFVAILINELDFSTLKSFVEGLDILIKELMELANKYSKLNSNLYI